jgi:hypothetical protein
MQCDVSDAYLGGDLFDGFEDALGGHVYPYQLARADKVIFKSKPAALHAALEAGHFALLDYVSECPDLLANSIKNEAVLSFLGKAAKGARTRLHLVLTDSLPFEFVRRVALPFPHAVFAGWDEIGRITGWRFEGTLEDAVRAAVLLRRYAPSAVGLSHTRRKRRDGARPRLVLRPSRRPRQSREIRHSAGGGRCGLESVFHERAQKFSKL